MNYLKLISIGLIVAAIFGAAWSWRGSIAETEQREAVESAVLTKLAEVQREVDAERESREEFRQQMTSTLQALSSDIRRIRNTRTEVVREVVEDRASHRPFYDQPLPDAGRAAWIKARQSAVSEDGNAQSAAQPASSPASR